MCREAVTMRMFAVQKASVRHTIIVKKITIIQVKMDAGASILFDADYVQSKKK
jgi:RNase P/RNase MRP subunit p29